jgi:hypothetical protein
VDGERLDARRVLIAAGVDTEHGRLKLTTTCKA